MAEQNPLVSIIVRTKDRPSLLKRALKSIGVQTYRPAEVLLVNDGGCDLELEELRDILGTVELNYIRFDHNVGRAAAGNEGIRNARGTYVCFLDDDDEFYENHLALLVPELIRSDVPVVYSDAAVVRKDDDWNTVGDKGVFSSYDFSYADLLVDNYIPLMCILFSGDLIKASGGFDETFDLYEDWDLLLRMGREHHFRHISTVTAQYSFWSSEAQIANVEGKEQTRREAHERIFYKHLKNLTPDVILHLKNKRDTIERNHAELITEYKRLEEETRGYIDRLNRADEKVSKMGAQIHDITAKHDALQSENRYLRNEIQTMVDSLGWRLLTRIRRFRDTLIPSHTKRRDAYNRAVFFVKSRRRRLNQVTVLPGSARDRRYRSWFKMHEPDSETLAVQRKESGDFRYRPKISIVVPVYNPETGMLESMLGSVMSQTYENWELCMADGNSEQKVRDILSRYEINDKRVKVKFLSENKHISGNSNEALSLVTGEFVGLLDQDDELTPNALFEVVSLLNGNPDADVIYSDEDKISQSGGLCSPFFKPDWSPDLLLNVNYICHLAVIRTALVKDAGGFREGYEGAQDFDLMLRVTRNTGEILHIPKILYHWRMHGQSTSVDVASKTYAHTAGERAVDDFLKSQNIQAQVTQGFGRTNYWIHYRIEGNPRVSIIIPFRDRVELLKRCITSIAEKTTYSNYEIVLVSNRSSEKKTGEFIDDLRANRPDIHLFEFNEEFNYSRVNNFAVQRTSGDYLLFLNNDTEVISPDWIESLLEHAQREEIGAVGCKLLFPDNTVQHAGVVLGMTGFAGHVFAGLPEHAYTYFGSTDFVRNYLAVTAACMMIKRERFERVGGFNEDFVLCGSDVELCLRMHEHGYRNIYTPHAVIYHHESASRRGCPIPPNDFRLSHDFYGKYLEQGDPYYNPNLTLLRTDCSLSSGDERDRLKKTVSHAVG